MSGWLPMRDLPGNRLPGSEWLARLARRSWLGWGLALWCLLGCMRSARLDQQVDRIGQLLLDAEANGALRCAPRELAVARSQLEFAELERAQGFSSKAEQHLVAADQNARAAKLLSPPEHCRPQPSVHPASPSR
jgi:OOP family OmpA-OmpF porin